LENFTLILEKHKKFGKIPASKSNGIYAIYNNAHNGIWEDYEINN
jgi:hypothetical protein